MNDWIQIFRTGKHTDSAGNEQMWTEADLDRIAAYDPARHEAPVVIGHPKDNAPAYGWVEGVKREGGVLYAKLKGMVPEFMEMVKKGMFKKRSISLYPDGTLRHIGFLGAVPPAVKGLEDFAFNEGNQTTIEFLETTPAFGHPSLTGGELGNTKGGNMIEEIKKMFADSVAELKAMLQPDKKGGSTDMTEQEKQKLIDDGVAAALKAKVTEFTEAAKKKETEFSERETALKAKEDALKVEAAAGRKKAVADFCEGLKKEGKLIPAMDKLGMGLTEFMSQIAGIETTVEFGEGDGKGKQTPLEFMQSFLSALPKAVEFGEVAGRAKDAGGTGNAGEKLDTLTVEKMKANKELKYATAFAEVQKEHPALAAEYAEELKG